MICAHCNAVLNTEYHISVIFSHILSNFGTAGVICFFLISGVLFNYKGNFCEFWKKKLVRFVPAWFISATIVYLYVYIRKPPVSFIGYINFVFGNGSYCYYLTILILIYLIFTIFPFMSNNIILVICSVITGIFTLSFHQIDGISPYLNIINWIGYFSLGKYIGRKLLVNVQKTIINKNRMYLAFLIYCVLVLYQIWRESPGSYWYGINTIVSWVGAFVIIILGIYLSLQKNNRYNNLLQYVMMSGKQSLFIYLWHMPIAGLIARLMNSSFLTYLIIIRPFLVYLIMIGAIAFCQKYFSRPVKHFIGLN